MDMTANDVCRRLHVNADILSITSRIASNGNLPRVTSMSNDSIDSLGSLSNGGVEQ